MKCIKKNHQSPIIYPKNFEYTGKGGEFSQFDKVYLKKKRSYVNIILNDEKQDVFFLKGGI